MNPTPPSIFTNSNELTSNSVNPNLPAARTAKYPYQTPIPLSGFSYVGLLFIPVIALLVLTYSPLEGIAILVALVPGLLVLIFFRVPLSQYTNRNQFLKILWTILPGLIPVLIAQITLDFVFGAFFFFSKIDLVLYIAVYSFFTSFIVASLTEEILKYCCTHRVAPTNEFAKARIIGAALYGLAAGLGFGIFENILYVLSAASTSGMQGIVVVGVLRTFTAVPFHCLTGVWIGLGLSVRNFKLGGFETFIKVIAVPFISHGVYNFLLFFQPAISLIFGTSVGMWYSLAAILFNISMIVVLSLMAKNAINLYQKTCDSRFVRVAPV
ncbi:hypothetical protein RCL1_000371 [Eukaryota sp. TZLM3-RCL]